jgi:hypothetical protein
MRREIVIPSSDDIITINQKLGQKLDQKLQKEIIERELPQLQLYCGS